MVGKFITTNTDLEELRVFALNWCFKNVEIVNK